MPVNLKGKSLLTLKDFTKEEITYLLKLSAELKAKKLAGEVYKPLCGKNIVLLFEKHLQEPDVLLKLHQWT